MGTEWIIKDACTRIGQQVGSRRWDQWEDVAEQLGLQVIRTDMDLSAPVTLTNNVIIVRRGVDDQVTALLAWQEIGYAVLQAGNVRTALQQLATEFAETFPDWE